MTRGRLKLRFADGRRGWSLIELLCVITMVAALSVTAVQLIIILMQAETQVGAEAARELTWQRLEDRFRDDVRQSAEAQLTIAEDGTRILVLEQSDGRQIEYRLFSGAVQRFVGGQTVEQDLFQVEEGRLSVEIHEPMVSLIHDGWGASERPPAEPVDEGPLRRTRIDARLRDGAGVRQVRVGL